ncbi:MAG TPA: YciI family protein [Thermoleophilaceae bacterium]|nr:YciI family protein [Thermoleophilaceae bacterium]
MRFVVFRKADDFTEAGAMPSRELVTAMLAYNRRMIDTGVLLDGMGLKPSREGVRVLFDGTGTSVVDGPFTESKELVAGFSLLQTRTREEALEWLRRWPAEDAPVRLELRQVIEEGDA